MASLPGPAPHAADPKRGVVLLLLSGLVALLLAVAFLFLNAAWLLARGASAGAEAASAGLAAASGMEYAAARLSGEGHPRGAAGPADRGDDWRFRDQAAPLAGALNPSYSHGEPWLAPELSDGFDNDGDAAIDEPDEGGGRYRRGFDAPGADRDGDGGFSAWTGRVRGGGGRGRSVFSLRLSAPGARLPVNAGCVDVVDRDGLDNDGSGTTDEPSEVDRYVNFASSGLAAVLNNLGAIVRPMALAPASGWHRRADAPAGGPGADPIRISWLGYDLVKRRPVGGYKDLEEIRRVLLDEGYSPDETALFLPHLDVGPYGDRTTRVRTDWDDRPRLTWMGGLPAGLRLRYPGVELATASETVLQSLWMYVSGPVWGLPGSPDAWDKPYTRSGAANLSFRQTDRNGWAMIPMIFPDEAALLAEEAAGMRRDGIYSWTELRTRFARSAGTLFRIDHDALSVGIPPPPLAAAHLLARRAWLRAKADLAALAVSPDPYPWNPQPATWCTGGVDFDDDLPGHQPFSALVCRHIGHVAYPPAVHGIAYPPGFGNAPFQWDPSGASDWFWAASSPVVVPGPFQPQSLSFPQIAPIGLSLAPPTRFTAEALGRAGGARASVQGRLLTAEILDLASQDDFDSRSYAASGWDRMGIQVLDPLGKEKNAWRTDPGSGRRYPATTSFPNLHSKASAAPLSRLYGGIALAGRETGADGAMLYWSFSEDLDGNAANDFWGEPTAAPYTTRIEIDPSSASGAYGSAPWGISDYSAGIGAKRISFPPLKCDMNTAPPADLPVSLEAWVLPPSARGAGSNQNAIVLGMKGALYSGSGMSQAYLSIEAGHESTTSAALAETSGVSFHLKVRWVNYSPSPVPPPFERKVLFIPDFDPLTGANAQTGFHHLLLTLEPLAGPDRVRYRLYVDGTFRYQMDYPDNGASMRMSKAHWNLQAILEGADEVRLHSGVVSAASRHAKGRFVPPAGPPAADVRDLLKALPDEPPNPVYRSPRFVLGSRASLRAADWLGLASEELKRDAWMRVVAFGFDGAGNLLGSVPLQSSGELSDLSALGRIHSFQLAVEFFRPPGASGDALYDTPVFESIWLALQRPGFAPGWSLWRIE